MWAAVIKQIRKYQGETDETPVSAVWRSVRIHHIISENMVSALRDIVLEIEEEVLGFKVAQVGTHSVRPGAAMALYLGEYPVYTIMMAGRWSSNVLLGYIRKQVEQFSHNVLKRIS